MRSRMTGVVMVLALLSPAAVLAQGNAPQIMQSFDLVTPPGAPVPGLAHVEDVRIGTARQFHIVVSTNDATAELTFDGKTVRLGDGYTVIRETLANTGGVYVTRLTGITPAGDSQSAIIVTNSSVKGGNAATSANVDRFAKLLIRAPISALWRACCRSQPAARRPRRAWRPREGPTALLRSPP